MQTSYGEMAPNYSDTLTKPIAVWRNALEPETYGFPLLKAWLGVERPLLNDRGWEFYGVLPVGTPVSRVTKQKDQRIRCEVGGLTIVTLEAVIEP